MSSDSGPTVIGALGIGLAAAIVLGWWSSDGWTTISLVAPVIIVAIVCQRFGLLRL